MFLDALRTHGLLLLALVTFGGALGLPLPASITLATTGALSASGDLPLIPAALVALAAVVAGDSAGYWLAHSLGRRALSRVGPRIGISSERMASAERQFRRRGGWLVWITRWLLTPLGAATNAVAGVHHYPFGSFLKLVVTGALLWVGGYMGVGWVLGDDVRAAVDTLGLASGSLTLLLAAVALGAGVCLWLMRRRRHTPGHAT